MTANAKNVTKPRIYYDNSNTSYGSVAFVVGHDNYSRCYKLTKISNTNLWYRYLNGTGNDSWTDATQIAVFGVDWDTSEGSSIANRRNYTGSKYTNTLTLTSDLNSDKVYLVTAAGNKSNTSIALQSGGYTDLNYTQTVQQQLTTDGTTYNASTEAIATVSVTSYKLSDYATTASNSGTIASGTSSATCSAARTATVTYTVSGVDAAYSFVGWYDGDTQKSTAATYTATSTEAKTITARFAVATEEEHEVTVTYMCGSTKVTDDASAYVGVETEKTFTAPTVTGYNFTGWTKGAGVVEKSSTENTITIVTKTGETDYTLVANYEVVNETIYFINAGKWADVYIHLWNGTATGTSWPGTQLTATGTKIGEYDVYEYTAQQGAHVNLLFHKKDNDSQKTTDLTWSEGVDKYYIHNHNGNTGWYTQAEAEAILVAPVVEETVYFVNNKNWTKVQVHAWKDAANNGWPGEALTATGDTVAGFAVYSFTAPQGTYTNLLFNNKEGDAGVQSNNFVWTDGKYYYMGAAADYAGGTKEDITTAVAPDPLATDVYLAGEMNSWNTTANEFKKATAEATTASVTVNLTAQTYKFKLIIGEGNWRGNTGTMKRGGDAVHEGGWSFEEEGGDDKNCKIVADIAGDYTFTWDLTNKKLTVTYPELPTYNVTATVNPAETGSVEGAKEYKQGEQATLTANAAEGYHFVNWTVGGKEVSTEATYSFTVTADIALVANFQATEPVVELPAASVRAWAYDLALAVEGEQYTFSYKATTAALATLIFTDGEGVELATVELGLVEAGANSVVLAKSELPTGKKVNWAVKLEAGAIENVVEVTDQSRGIYDFYNMMDVLVDNNPESEYFGKIYIQQSYEYTSGNTADRNKTQKAGIFIYDQQLNELNNPANVGIQPAMPAGYTKIGTSREAFKRLAIDPVTGNLVFGNNIAGEGSVWSISRDSLTGTPTNLISGVSEISKAAAICYDKDGSLYVLANITTGSTKYNLYKFTNGEKTELTLQGAKIFIDSDVAMTSDGRGGLWISQRRSGITQYSILSHVNVAQDTADFVLETGKEYSDWFAGNCYRAAVAYNEKENLLAVQGAKKISLFNVSYDETTGVPSITKYLQTSVGGSVDGLAFDYAGDLYTVNSGSEIFQKFAMPTETNVCTTPAASKYAFQNIEYDTMEITMTNLEVAEVGGYLVLTASDDSNTGLNVMLAVNEDGSLAADSYMAMVQGWNEVELPIVEGTITKTYSEELATDVYSGLVVVEYNEGYLGLDLTMYYVAPEYTDIVITNATVTEDIRDLGWGDETYTVLLLESTWSDGVETYPVLVEVNDYDLSVVEGTAVVSVTIGGQGDEDPWLGNVPDGEMKYTIADGVITLQGKLENASARPAPVYWNLTISGKLPQGPTTALDNIAVEAKAIKMIKNGQLIIIKNGVQYNVQGQVIK